MDQLITFYSDHLLLVSAFLAVTSILTWLTMGGVANKNALDALAATELINHNDAVVIDVRTKAEFKQGHIINSLNVPLDSLKNQFKSLEKHKSKPIIVSCRSGSRSALACKLLGAAGFEQVHNLRGGMLAWESANMPVRRKAKK